VKESTSKRPWRAFADQLLAKRIVMVIENSGKEGKEGGGGAFRRGGKREKVVSRAPHYSWAKRRTLEGT